MEMEMNTIALEKPVALRRPNGQFGKGNTIGLRNGSGRPRGAKDQLTVLRNVIFDCLFDPIGENGELRLQEAIRTSKPEHILALAGKLVPKSVELTMSSDTEVVPIVLDALDVKSVDTKKPASINEDTNGRKQLNL